MTTTSTTGPAPHPAAPPILWGSATAPLMSGSFCGAPALAAAPALLSRSMTVDEVAKALIARWSGQVGMGHERAREWAQGVLRDACDPVGGLLLRVALRGTETRPTLVVVTGEGEDRVERPLDECGLDPDRSVGLDTDGRPGVDLSGRALAPDDADRIVSRAALAVAAANAADLIDLSPSTEARHARRVAVAELLRAATARRLHAFDPFASPGGPRMAPLPWPPTAYDAYLLHCVPELHNRAVPTSEVVRLLAMRTGSRTLEAEVLVASAAPVFGGHLLRLRMAPRPDGDTKLALLGVEPNGQHRERDLELANIPGIEHLRVGPSGALGHRPEHEQSTGVDWLVSRAAIAEHAARGTTVAEGGQPALEVRHQVARTTVRTLLAALLPETEVRALPAGVVAARMSEWDPSGELSSRWLETQSSLLHLSARSWYAPPVVLPNPHLPMLWERLGGKHMQLDSETADLLRVHEDGQLVFADERGETGEWVTTRHALLGRSALHREQVREARRQDSAEARRRQEEKARLRQQQLVMRVGPHLDALAVSLAAAGLGRGVLVLPDESGRYETELVLTDGEVSRWATDLLARGLGVQAGGLQLRGPGLGALARRAAWRVQEPGGAATVLRILLTLRPPRGTLIPARWRPEVRRLADGLRVRVPQASLEAVAATLADLEYGEAERGAGRPWWSVWTGGWSAVRGAYVSVETAREEVAAQRRAVGSAAEQLARQALRSGSRATALEMSRVAAASHRYGAGSTTTPH